MRILVTGAKGFIGKNLISILNTLDHEVLSFDSMNTNAELESMTATCDFVVHLAGVNRPTAPDEFYTGNADLTHTLTQYLQSAKNKCPVLMSSSIQATADNDYGKSKKQGEDYLLEHAKQNNSAVYIYRFKNLYGKWSRPNYNSVVATWCYNIARGIDVRVDNPTTKLELCYIDDVVEAIIGQLGGNAKTGLYTIENTDVIKLGELHDLLVSFRETRDDKLLPDQSKPLYKNLYATYLSYLPQDAFSYPLTTHRDERGGFAEFIKSQADGQVSINISKPGVTKGQHWHSTKNEKFLVVKGSGIIRLRDIFSKDVIEYPVSGDSLEVVDIPTGYTHSLVNVGDEDMITVIWANELFDVDSPDTNKEEV